MAYDYIYTPNANLETGKPARAVDIRAIRDMAPAIAEGSKDAPRIMPKALANGLLVHGIPSSSSLIGATDLEGVKRLFIRGFRTADSALLRMRFGQDNGASYGAWQTISPGAGSAAGIEVAGWIDLENLTSAINSISSVATMATPSLSIPANTNAIQFSGTTATASWSVSMHVLEGRADV